MGKPFVEIVMFPESIVKLRLRRNGISIHANTDNRGQDGMLYIVCNIGKLGNTDAVYGSVTFSFIRNVTFELGDAGFDSKLESHIECAFLNLFKVLLKLPHEKPCIITRNSSKRI